ncbi:LacI family DNA-binding transcriptional regulator [Demequina litorisediminis]|uniref:LacI family DNA-binding transcriptional regulator n=1 Tax=Demequina litorisediminis TaxID=1849022 RepID=UPI0024E1195C|nr:LacI family DNA-binding transcriptional regulator [Demequina litorisediminis]
MREVARLAGVSVGTVSNVLNRPDQVKDATVERVREAIAEPGLRSERRRAPTPRWPVHHGGARRARCLEPVLHRRGTWR